MSQYIQMLKQWHQLAKPNKKYWLFQFISIVIPSVCLVFESYYLAKVTTCVSAGNWDYAIANLIIAFAILVIRNFSWDFNYRNNMKLVGRSYLRIQSQLYDKIIGASDSNLNDNSKEKLINIMHDAVYTVSNFSDVICSKFRYLISSLICVGYVMFANIYMGFIMVAALFVNIFVIGKINDKISTATRNIKIATDNEYEAFSQAIESKNYVKDLGIKEKVKQKTLDASYDFIKSDYKSDVAWSYLDNYFYIFYRFIRFALTIALIFLLKDDLITLTAYFVIVSYIADTLSYNNDFCKLFTELKNVQVAVARINIILNFQDRKVLEYGDVNNSDISGEVDFVDVYYNDPDNDEFQLQDLHDVTFHVGNNECVLFKGNRGCGKRTIFYLLRRVVEVNSGEIYVGRTALRDYSADTHIENINYVTTKPYFFKDTIRANLKLVNGNDEEIENACKLANVYDAIMELKDGFDSPVDKLTQRDKYLLSVARTLLMHSEIVIFYEFPAYLSNDDEEVVKSVIDIIRLNRTAIVFSATSACESIADRVYKVADGTVELVKDNTELNKSTSVFDALDDYDNALKSRNKSSKKKGLKQLLKRYAKENIGKK